MRISELVEAITPIGSTTDPISPNGLPKTGQSSTPKAPPSFPAPIKPATPGTSPAPTLGNQAPIGQPPAMQQGMNDTITDLNKISAQIVGLKQKHQQMQQQMQQNLTTPR